HRRRPAGRWRRTRSRGRWWRCCRAGRCGPSAGLSGQAPGHVSAARAARSAVWAGWAAEAGPPRARARRSWSPPPLGGLGVAAHLLVLAGGLPVRAGALGGLVLGAGHAVVGAVGGVAGDAGLHQRVVNLGP